MNVKSSLPDYFLNRQYGKDTITEFNNKFLFSFKNGTGSSIEHDSLNQYIETVKNSYPDFDLLFIVTIT